MTTSTLNSRLIPSTQYVTPSTGDTVTANDSGNVTMLINPAGTLVALTFAFNASPTNGDVVTLGASQIVTGLTMSGGTIIGGLSALAVASFASYQYNSTASKWFRVG